MLHAWRTGCKAPGIRHQVSGTGYKAPGTRHQVRYVLQYQAQGIRHLQYQVPSQEGSCAVVGCSVSCCGAVQADSKHVNGSRSGVCVSGSEWYVRYGTVPYYGM